MHLLVLLCELKYSFNEWIWNALELRYKEHIHYIMSNNVEVSLCQPYSCQCTWIRAHWYYHNTITISTKGRCMNILENYFVQLFQHNKIVNEQTLKKKKNSTISIDLWSAGTSCMCLKTPHTLHSLPSTSAIHQSEMFPCDTHLCRECRYITKLTIILLFHSNIQLFIFDTDRLTSTSVLFSFSLQGVPTLTTSNNTPSFCVFKKNKFYLLLVIDKLTFNDFIESLRNTL